MDVRVTEFHAEWCGPCDQQEPIIDELEEDRDDIEIRRVDVDEEPEIANKYHVRGVPATVVESDNGVEQRFDGVTQRDDIEAVVDSVQNDSPL